MIGFQRRYRENVVLQSVLKFIADVIVVVCVAYALVNYTCDRTQIVGNSMNTQLENDDTVFINKFAYAFLNPDRYDVIVFETEGVSSSKKYIKRVIGLPGETVQITNGKVYIDGFQLEDDVVTEYILTAGLASEQIQLGEDEFFVLGDNRNNSEDSRFSNIGTIQKDSIIGSAWLVASPFSHIKLIK